MKTKYYIGLDVHKNSIAVAYANALDRSPATLHGKWGGSTLAAERGALKLLKKLHANKEEVLFCYEAGPTGFVLARRLLKLGYPCIVVAPSAIPKAPGEKVKTDRRDARKLATLLRGGEISGIHIPDVDDEAIRDLVRARTDASEDRARAKKQLLMFLLRNGLAYSGKTNWSQAHMNYLRGLTMPSPAQQIVLEESIIAIDSANDRILRIEQHLEAMLTSWKRAPYVRALMSFRGFDTVASMVIVSELGDLSRFHNPRQLMAYLGLVPSEASSGERRKQGGITKCGNSHARWMLIESATHNRYPPRVSERLSHRQAGQSREVRAISWRAQQRLNYRFRTLTARRLHHNKVTVAVARELIAFIWELHHQVTKELTPA
ncbi:MAG: IS110 family transposase [Verrucomicrobiota bacterium]